MDKVKIIAAGQEKEYVADVSFEQIAEDFKDLYDSPIVMASLNNKLYELFKPCSKDGVVQFYTMKDSIGYKAYVRSVTMLFFKAMNDVFGLEAANHSRVEFAVGDGSYVNPHPSVAPTQENADKLLARMRELTELNVPFVKRSYHIDDAMELFREKGMDDKEKLFHYRRSSHVNIYTLDGYCDYYFGYMLPHTGYLKWYDLIPYDEGFMLLMPQKSNPSVVKPFEERRKLFLTLKESAKWGDAIGLDTIGELNDQICNGSMSDMILVQEAEQERKIGEIAKQIAARGGVKFIMIAGPSSSGKTSFSHRLSIQLRTLGFTPHAIAVDDYFVNREDTPLDENGNYNFECIEAIDVVKFNEDMLKLLSGERVELPTFNFKQGQREYHGNFKQLGPDDILVIEGIHGLNPQMSYALPDASKFKIYISALTNINIDNHNRIPTTDGRLLRRMIRDARTRGTVAQKTIAMWPSVRRGEEEYIFPFQEEADAMFNSVLIYELAMLKQFAEPYLFPIERGEAEYYEAKRLLKFLDYFLGLSCEELPHNSICREFVGGSCFNV